MKRKPIHRRHQLPAGPVATRADSRQASDNDHRRQLRRIWRGLTDPQTAWNAPPAWIGGRRVLGVRSRATRDRRRQRQPVVRTGGARGSPLPRPQHERSVPNDRLTPSLVLEVERAAFESPHLPEQHWGVTLDQGGPSCRFGAEASDLPVVERVVSGLRWPRWQSALGVRTVGASMRLAAKTSSAGHGRVGDGGRPGG